MRKRTNIEMKLKGIANNVMEKADKSLKKFEEIDDLLYDSPEGCFVGTCANLGFAIICASIYYAIKGKKKED